MTNEEKQVVLEALERGKVACDGHPYFENSRWKSLPRLMGKAMKIVRETIPSD
jgi:hypothetical protein